MAVLNNAVYYLWHYDELRSMIQWKVWHTPIHEREESKESPSLRTCFVYLERTSRSFSAVIQELHPELLVPVALFYLILRGLDTIEDDMTISASKKEPLLRTFHTIISEEGWTFDGSGPNEKDRGLLVDFKVVIEEFNQIKPAYRAVIEDITEKMGNGMAEYANDAEFKSGVKTIEEYNLYCHYVAGLVGEGLTRLFVEANLANPILLDRPHLHESMGQFLQKTNIIRDIKEDWDDKRRFWPQEIWSKYVDNFGDLFEEKNRDAALNCSSEMVLNSLEHASECLFYLAGIKDQSVFNFTAIPQAMAIATLELVFRNPEIYKRNIKITKGQACRLMLDSSQSLKPVCDIFTTYLKKIQKKNTPKDPNFLKISIACGKVEQFIQSIFPTQDPRLLNAAAEAKNQGEVIPELDPKKAAAEAEARKDTFIMLAIVMGSLFTLSCIMILIAWWLGARFDVAYNDLTGKTPKGSPKVGAGKHNEL